MNKTPVDEFNISWDVPPDVFAFLAKYPEATLRQRADVAGVDQFRRWRAGIPLPVETYFERLPDIADDVELRLEMIVHEFEYAQFFTEPPDANEFAERFPDVRDRVLELIFSEQNDSVSDSAAAANSDEITVILGDAMVPTSTSDVSADDGCAQHGDFSAAAPFLAKCDTFSSLPIDVLQMIESQMFRQRYQAGDYVLRQGEPGGSLLVICDGVVEISTDDGEAGHHFIGRISTGQVIGEMSLLTDEPRTADAVAKTEVTALVLTADLFHKLALEYPNISVLLTRLFAKRLGGKGRDVLAGKTFGGYLFRRNLGQGGMGVVYKANDVETGQVVALKMMSHRLVYDARALKDFQREADIIESFEHPNIVTTYGRFEAFHTFFIAMQYCDGYTLEDVINANGSLPEAEFRKIIGQVAAALGHAHAHNVIHRDVKPANIMLNRDGSVRLMDFGLAKPVEDDEDCEDCSIVGTPRYMAPEQLRGLNVGKEADYFALGCVAYKMLTGNILFNGSTLRQLRREHAHFSIPDLRTVSPPLSIATYWLLEQCLERTPDRRRPSMKKIAAWAAPFSTDLLAKVTGNISPDTVSEETLIE